MSGKRATPGRGVGVVGTITGVLAGVATVLIAGAAGAQLAPDEGASVLEATHLPPLLTARDEPVELTYDVYCAGFAEAAAAGTCDATGTVFVREGEVGAFREIALDAAGPGPGRSLVARIPRELARSRSGFTYFAVLRSAAAGRALTLPPGGAESPQQSLPLGRPLTVALGVHEFGRARAADRRPVAAPWGTGPGEVGLEQGRNLPPIGGSSFDVSREGTVSVLDEANRRLLRWHPGSSTPEHVPLVVRGTVADLLVDDEGTIHVLETTADPGESPLLRIFGRDGRSRASVEMVIGSSSVRTGADGPVVLEQSSGQWTSAAVAGRPLTASERRATGRSGRPLRGGGEVVVLRLGNEIRVALVGQTGARRTWRVASDTALAEVQLAEPYGDGLLLVVRAFTDDRSEFVVLALDRDGIVQRFSLDAADWAETAPLSRFRLVGSSLYQLGSTPAGFFVDRFDLEVR